jgi:hypothetical protein
MEDAKYKFNYNRVTANPAYKGSSAAIEAAPVLPEAAPEQPQAAPAGGKGLKMKVRKRKWRKRRVTDKGS